jgi:RNA polymerase sigma-70 factor (ECF subfamily)
MSGPVPPGRSTLLILRLLECPTDAAAWGEFVQRYAGIIYAWCRRYGLQDADAQDVTQIVFAALLSRLQGFDRSKARFRSWLYRIVQNAVRDWCQDRARREEKGTESARQLLASQPARRDLKERLTEEFDLELLEVAEASVRLKVSPQTWNAYWFRCKDGLSLRQAAERIGIPAGHVSKYALRVQGMVARELAILDGVCGAAPDRVAEGQDERLPLSGEMAAVPPGPAEPAGGSRPHRAPRGV